jgi:hypothetical protein
MSALLYTRATDPDVERDRDYPLNGKYGLTVQRGVQRNGSDCTSPTDAERTQGHTTLLTVRLLITRVPLQH